MKIFNSVINLGFLFMLSGCFYLGPFFSASDAFAETPKDKNVVIGITHVKLAHKPEKNTIFWNYTRQTIRSLPEHQGYLGHKMRKKLFVNDAWTMTVWENEDALNNFVRGNTHGRAMSKGLPAVKSAHFVRISLPRSEAPLTWKEAEKVMKVKGRRLY